MDRPVPTRARPKSSWQRQMLPHARELRRSDSTDAGEIFGPNGRVPRHRATRRWLPQSPVRHPEAAGARPRPPGSDRYARPPPSGRLRASSRTRSALSSRSSAGRSTAGASVTTSGGLSSQRAAADSASTSATKPRTRRSSGVVDMEGTVSQSGGRWNGRNGRLQRADATAGGVTGRARSTSTARARASSYCSLDVARRGLSPLGASGRRAPRVWTCTCTWIVLVHGGWLSLPGRPLGDHRADSPALAPRPHLSVLVRMPQHVRRDRSRSR